MTGQEAEQEDSPRWPAGEGETAGVPGPEELLDRYQRRIFAVIHRMTGRHADVEDLCQETWVQIFRSLSRFQPGTNLDSWVYRIAMNVSVDHLRRRGKENSARETLGRTTPSGTGPETTDSEVERAVHRAVEGLPPEQKAVVVLRVFEGLSHDEISVIVEAPAATVRWRLFSAMAKLEQVLGPIAREDGE